jgi:hypothetical protein
MSQQYEATVRIAVKENTEWNGSDIADEITSWLEDLGFEVQVTVREVLDEA